MTPKSVTYIHEFRDGFRTEVTLPLGNGDGMVPAVVKWSPRYDPEFHRSVMGEYSRWRDYVLREYQQLVKSQLLVIDVHPNK